MQANPKRLQSLLCNVEYYFTYAGCFLNSLAFRIYWPTFFIQCAVFNIETSFQQFQQPTQKFSTDFQQLTPTFQQVFNKFSTDIWRTYEEITEFSTVTPEFSTVYG